MTLFSFNESYGCLSDNTAARKNETTDVLGGHRLSLLLTGFTLTFIFLNVFFHQPYYRTCTRK
jgi:hypothetical protein